MKKVGIVACSNGQKREYSSQNDELVSFLASAGLEARLSSCLYEVNNVFSGSTEERAKQLMELFRDPETEEIYDISGGDVANQILDYLDFGAIAESKATFWGYSDLTTVINAIYAMTGRESVLWNIKNMSYGDHVELQKHRFLYREELFDSEFRFIQGSSMSGIVVGGNIRCFLKLAGTRYFPELTDKLLLLEALGGDVPQMATYLAQLQQLGAFRKVRGILLGSFTTMEKNQSKPDMVTLVKEYAGRDMPIAKTREIGHGSDAKAIVIGRELTLQQNC